MDYIVINKLITKPYYKQITDSIKNAIFTYVIKDKDQLPTELEVSNFFDISTGIVKRAYDSLEKEGLIKRIKGKGSFITYRTSFAIDVKSLRFGHPNFIPQLHLNQKCLSKEIIDSDDIMGFPKDIYANKSYVKFITLNYYKHEKVMIDMVYFQHDLYPYIETMYPNPNSLVEISKQFFNIPLSKQSNRILSIQASDDLARLLNIDINDPITKIISIYSTTDQQIAIYQVRLFISDIIRIESGF